MKKFNLFLFACCILIMSCNDKNIKQENMTKFIDINNMDLTINPGNDFYMYANKNWLINNPIPEEYSRWGAFNELNEQNELKLKDLLENARNEFNQTNNENIKKLAAFYISGMDTIAIEKRKFEDLKPLFEKVNSIKSKEDIEYIISELHQINIFPFFYIFPGQDEMNSKMVIAQLYQGGLGLPDMSYYIENNERAKEIRFEYLNHITNIFKLFGENDEKAKKISESIFEIEKKLAQNSFTRLEQRDPYKNYNKYKLNEIKDIIDFKWEQYFNNIGIKENIEVNVCQLSFFQSIPEIIKKDDLENLKFYLKWNIIRNLAPYLNSEIELENFKFYGTALSGNIKQQDRWKRVLNKANNNVGEIIGQLYVEKYFPPQAKEKITELVVNIKESFKERIKNIDWMSDSTKEKALNKLEKINLKLGYPDKWIDYSGLTLSESSYVNNIINSNRFNFKLEIEKINKPVDLQEWHMTPQTVNAYYSPNSNEIAFPAAILQSPFFNFEADDAVNYGGIGAVIAHELTHGFDDQGRQYDLNGNLSDWWTEQDATNFNKKTEVLVEQFNNFKILDSLNVDGKLTLGENIADLGGVTISLNALKKIIDNNSKIDDFTPIQRFFISYAIIWRINIRDKELMRRLKEDVHSPGIARVNGIVYNVPEFYEAFGVSDKDLNYIKPENRAKIW